MTSPESTPVVLHADAEHGGIRAAVLATLLLAGWLSFLIIRAVIREFNPESDYIGLVSCAGALPVALVLVWIVEQALKRVWPSGRSLTLDEQGIRVRDPEEGDRVFNWSENLSRLNWFFRLSGYRRGGHERRVPKSWLCLACQLQQNGHRLVVFGYLTPKTAEPWTEGNGNVLGFHRIKPADVYDTSFRSRFAMPTRPEIPAQVLAGRDGRYWLAERRRWTQGFELSPKDFETFLRYVRYYHEESGDD